MNPLAWYNLLFYIPIAVGLFIALGTATGMADLHHGVDVDGDGHIDHHVHHDAAEKAGFSLLSMLGFGKAPMLLVVMTMALTFGGTGAICNIMLSEHIKRAPFLALFSLAVAVAAAVVFTGSFARLVSRLMPTLETSVKGKAEIVGSTGRLLLGADKESGLAQILKDGDVHQIQVRSDTAIEKGATVLVTEYDPATDTYAVDLYTLERLA